MPAFYGSRKYDALGQLTPQTKAFVAGVQAAGGSLQSGQPKIIDRTLVRPLLSSGLWTSFTALYPFIGGSAAAHSINLVAPSSFPITWFGTVTHDANGITGNGTSGYGRTGIICGTNLGSTAHMAIYNRTAAPGAAKVWAGAFNLLIPTTDSGFSMGNSASSADITGRINTSTIIFLNSPSALHGWITANTSGSAVQYLRRYYNGVTQNQSSTSTTKQPNLEIYLLNFNVDNAPFATTYSNINMALFSAGASLTTAQADTLGAIVEQYQNALGRLV